MGERKQIHFIINTLELDLLDFFLPAPANRPLSLVCCSKRERLKIMNLSGSPSPCTYNRSNKPNNDDDAKAINEIK